MIDTDAIICELYTPGSLAYDILTEHSRCVADKALDAAGAVAHLNPDLGFIEEAALLHDIGIIFTDSPSIGCHGNQPYLFHGFMGRDFLEKKGLPVHALVSERHTLTGLTRDAIVSRNLGLPERDMVPVTLEETIICFADKFFSKTKGEIGTPKPVDTILTQLSNYGEEYVLTFKTWLETFGY